MRAAGLGEVYDLRETAGPASPPNKTPAAAPGLLPAGTSLGSVYGFPVVYIRAPASFERWDFSGWSVSVEPNDTAVSFTDCRFQAHPDSGLMALYGGTLSGASGIEVTLTRCLLDGATNLAPGAGPPGPHPAQNLLSVNSTLTAVRSVFVRASGTTFNADGPGATSLSWCYFGCPAQKVFSSSDPLFNSHAEVGNISGGAVSIDHCLIDAADGAEQALAVHAETCMSGLFLWQARNHPVVASVSNSLLLIRNLPSFYTMQGGDDVHGIDLTFTGNVIQRASYVGGVAGGYLFLTSANCHGSGNIDFDSGALIAGPLNGA